MTAQRTSKECGKTCHKKEGMPKATNICVFKGPEKQPGTAKRAWLETGSALKIGGGFGVPESNMTGRTQRASKAQKGSKKAGEER